VLFYGSRGPRREKEGGGYNKTMEGHILQEAIERGLKEEVSRRERRGHLRLGLSP